MFGKINTYFEFPGAAKALHWARLDEGLPPLCLPILVYMDNPYRCNK